MINSVCVFGDSVARGVIFDQARKKYRFLKDNFISIIEKRQNLSVANFAKYGCTVTMGMEIINRHLKELSSYDYTLLEFGGNDCDYDWSEIAENPEENHQCNTPIDYFKEQYTVLIRKIKENNGRPVLLNLPPIDSKRYFSWVSSGLNENGILRYIGSIDTIYNWQKKYNDIVEEIALKEQVPLIDIRSIFLSKKSFSDYLCIDGIHPNEEGHKLISNAIRERAF